MSRTRPPSPTPVEPLCIPSKIILLSRYRHNIHICLLNFPEEDKPLIRLVITHLLARVYGINLKGEPSSLDLVTWGEASIPCMEKCTSLTRKGVVYSLENLMDSPEWDTWVDYSSPHTRLVWRSHFQSILHKCIWYALTSEDIRANLRSVMWGVGIKGYPSRWWLPTLRKFYRSTTLDRILPLDLLLLWVREGEAFSS